MSPGAEQHPTRPRFTLPAAAVLRDRADKVGEQLARTGRPRRRYLNEQRVRLASRLIPTLATCAAVCGLVTVVDLFVRHPPVPRYATLAQSFVTILVGGCALGVPIARRNLVALRALAAFAAVVLNIGWSFVTRATGGLTSYYLLAAPLALTAAFALLPLPPRVTVALGV